LQTTSLHGWQALLLASLVDEGLVDVGDDSTAGDGGLRKMDGYLSFQELDARKDRIQIPIYRFIAAMYMIGRVQRYVKTL
jgi:hypothetical protein